MQGERGIKFACSFTWVHRKWVQTFYRNGKRIKQRRIDKENQEHFEKEWKDAMVIYERCGISPIETIFGRNDKLCPQFFELAKKEGVCMNFKEFAGDKVSWQEITNELLYEYRDWLTRKGYAQNTRRVYMNQVQKILEKGKVIGCPVRAREWNHILKEKQAPSLNVYLTMEEVKKLEDIHFENRRMETARVIFLIGCYTGARFSDYSRLKDSSIVKGEYLDANGNIQPVENIQYVSIKTGSFCKIPANPKAIHLINDVKVDSISLELMNEYLPRVCEAAGIVSIVEVFRMDKHMRGRKCDFVTTHTARRTFANNLYMLGVPLETIATYLGHSSVDTTLKSYISCPLRITETALNKYFR